MIEQAVVIEKILAHPNLKARSPPCTTPLRCDPPDEAELYQNPVTHFLSASSGVTLMIAHADSMKTPKIPA